MKRKPNFVAVLLFSTAFTCGFNIAATNAAEQSTDSTWKPQASERLVKLPAQYLKKRLDHDFAESGLGKALAQQEDKIAGKSQTLTDLQRAVGQAEGNVRTELRHQFLAEKRAFLEMMTDKNVLRRKKLTTDLKLFERMLGKLSENDTVATPARRQLIEAQEAAQKRFQSSIARVDAKLFQSTAMPESKYSVKYAENMAAVEKLVARIQSHKMNSSPSVDGQLVTKAEYIRGMVADAQAELAILDQEQTILGYMAKLVALDAMALSEETVDTDLIDAPLLPKPNVASTVGFFTNN